MKKIIENIHRIYNNPNLSTFEMDLDQIHPNLKVNSELDFLSFLEFLKEVKNTYIIRSDEITSNTDARRIAILVTNCYLEYGGDIYKADFLERRIYETCKTLYFTCLSIPEEDRIEEKFSKDEAELKKKEVIKKKILRLGIERKGNKVRIERCYLTKLIINLLEEDLEDGESKLENSGFNQRGPGYKIIQSQQTNYLKMEDEARFTLHKIGEQILLPRAGFYDLDSENEN